MQALFSLLVLLAVFSFIYGLLSIIVSFLEKR